MYKRFDIKGPAVRCAVATVGTVFFPLGLLWSVTYIAYWLAGSPTERTTTYGGWWLPVTVCIAFFGGFAFTFLFRLHWILRVLLFVAYAPAQAGILVFYTMSAGCYLGNNCL